jgi:hypothetical protein
MPIRKILIVAAPLLALAAPSTAFAGEVFGGLYVHDVKTPLNLSGIEGGMDVMAGWRGGRIGATRLQPYAFAALNTAGETSYAAAGLSAKFGDRIFIRPGLGIAVHTGSDDEFQRFDRIAFGSRVLFEPELGIGARISGRTTIEASIVHMSHGGLLSGQNPGIDNIGVRLSFGL